MTALAFLEQLWPEKPAAAAIQIWDKQSKKTYTFDTPQLAANFAERQAHQGDVYVAAGLAPRVDAPMKRRATTQQVVGIPGLWADIDINGGPDGKTGAAPDEAAALALAASIIEPTLIVNSGYGLQAWWLLDDPWIFALESERNQAVRLSHGFQALLKSKARAQGFGIDSTHDLARLMRLPGTLNHKGSLPAEVVFMQDDGKRYSVEIMTELAEHFISSASGNGGPDVEIGEIGTPDLMMIDELKDIDPEFGATWEGSRAGRRAQWGESEYDMAIANHLVNIGCGDQDIANAIGYFRKRHGDSKGKGQRPDYIRLTIAKARTAHAAREGVERREREVEEAVERLGEIADSESPVAPSVTVDLFSRVVGGPKIKELIQVGLDPDMARYTLMFEDGQELTIGSPADLINHERFRARFMAMTTHLPPKRPPAEWDTAVRALLSAVQISADEDSTVEGQGTVWLEAYLERRLSRDRDGACRARDPYEEDGKVYVPLSEFSQWVRRTKGERITDMDIKQMLRRVGFERTVVAYKREDDSRSSRSYYVADRIAVFGSEAAPWAYAEDAESA